MPKENENKKIINNAEAEQAIASSSKQITSTEITENIDKIIARNDNLSHIPSLESHKNLEQEIKDNKLYWMKPKDREELAESFSGVDRILYDRLEKKAGKKQEHAGGLVALNVVGYIPIVGGVFNTAQTAEQDNLKIELEKSFSVSEVKEIVEELGMTKINKNTEWLKQVKRQIIELEKTAEQEIQKRTEKIADQEKKINENKETIKNFEAAGEQLKNQLISNEKANREQKEKFIEVSEKLETEKNNFLQLQEQKNRLTSEKEELNEKINNFLNKESEWESQKQEIEQLINKKEQEVQELAKNLSLREKEVKNYEEAAIKVSQRLAKNRTLPDPAKISHDELKKEYQNLQNEREQQEILLAGLQVEISNKNERINYLNSDIENLKNEVSDWEQKISEKRGEIYELEKKINELKLVMDNKEREIKELKEKIEKLEAEKQRLESKISEIREENKKEVNKLIDEKSELGSQLIKKISEAEQQRIDIGQLEVEINSKDRDLESNAYWMEDRNEKLAAAEEEQTREKTRADIAERATARKEQTINQLNRKINELEKIEKGNYFQQAINKLGFNSVGGIIQNGIILIIALFFLAIAAWIWKNLVKPAFSKSENQQIKELSQKNAELEGNLLALQNKDKELEGILIAKDEQITELKTTLNSLKLEAKKSEHEKEKSEEPETEK